MDIEKRKKISIRSLIDMKKKKEPIVFVTAYDYPSACRADRAGVDMILVGDSIGMTMFGYDNTLAVTMNLMIPHVEAVCRAVKYAFVVGDMPYMSYQLSNIDAVKNASRFIRAGCSAVKCEGGGKGVTERIKSMVDSGTLVMGHLGLTPQNLAMLGGYTVQWRNKESIDKLVKEAEAVRDAGAFAILLEAVPPEAGKRIADSFKIPIYGIGAGPDVDGQLLIWHDIMGTFEGKLGNGVQIPKFAKRYTNIGELEERALRKYAEEVRNLKFPTGKHCYRMDSY